jgi:Iron/manganese superoxide dismutases, C-terminal domain
MRPQHFVVPEAVTVRPFLLKPQWMNGLSERLLVSHYVNHYGDAVQRLNAIRARLAALDLAHTPPFEINGLKREELTAAASVILHELYFESLGGHGDNPPSGRTEPPAGLAQALERDFGSVMAWHAEFSTMAKTLAGDAGWAMLVWSERLGRLVNDSGPCAWPSRRYSDPGARSLRACLSARLWRGCRCLRRSGDEKSALGTNWCAVSPRDGRSNGRRRALPSIRFAAAKRGAHFGRGAQGCTRE